MKYHSETYIGPLLRPIGTMKFTATSASPSRASGSIQKGVSPHSRPWAPRLIGRCHRFASSSSQG